MLQTPPLIRLDETSSTNEEAFLRQAAGEAAPFFLTADMQTAGRGRAGRNWISPKGNLYLSACLQNPCPAGRLHQLGFVAGVALVRSLKQLAPQSDFRLKWPNDILEGKAKLAGVLLEARKQEGANVVVIGWGVNIVTAPHDLPYPATALNDNHPQIDRDRVLSELMENFMSLFRLWDHSKNFAAIRQLWLDHALPLNSPLCVKPDGTQKIEGCFSGIDEDGALLIDTQTGRQRVLAGDTIWPNPSAGAA